MRNEQLIGERVALVREIVNRCGDVGKTKIQKIVYFLQAEIGVPLRYRFKMHYFGPYSEGLDDTLSLASSLGYIDIRPDLNGFGYHVTPAEPIPDAWLRDYDVSNSPHFDRIDRVIDDLRNRETLALELFATIHMISRQKARPSKDETLAIVGKVKPGFTSERISGAYHALEEAGLI